MLTFYTEIPSCLPQMWSYFPKREVKLVNITKTPHIGTIKLCSLTLKHMQALFVIADRLNCQLGHPKSQISRGL